MRFKTSRLIFGAVIMLVLAAATVLASVAVFRIMENIPAGGQTPDEDALPVFAAYESPPAPPIFAPMPFPAPPPVVEYEEQEYEEIYEPGPEIITLTISAAGDITLGGYYAETGYQRFMRLYAEYGPTFFLRYTRHIFEASDLAIANLEGTLTDSRIRSDNRWVFRAPPSFARILTYGAVDIVTLANNHTFDYFEQGYRDTIAALEAEGIYYFGNEFNTLLEINGIKVGLFGYLMWNDQPRHRTNILNSIADLRERGAQLIIAYYHWGEMMETMPRQYQRDLGRFSIDNGVDLVLGAHPHIIQGIEMHDGRFIVHSLADFCYAGHANPSDQDSFIFQQTFTFIDGELQVDDNINIIPIFMSSTRRYNNFQPIEAFGDDGQRILDRLRLYSSWLNNAETREAMERFFVVREVLPEEPPMYYAFQD